jgi:hypothetical protein
VGNLPVAAGNLRAAAGNSLVVDSLLVVETLLGKNQLVEELKKSKMIVIK